MSKSHEAAHSGVLERVRAAPSGNVGGGFALQPCDYVRYGRAPVGVRRVDDVEIVICPDARRREQDQLALMDPIANENLRQQCKALMSKRRHQRHLELLDDDGGRGG